MKRLVALAALAVSGSAYATVWNEIPDAGMLVGTAQHTIGVGALQIINGRLSSNLDADLYCINIVDPAKFSATVANTPMDDGNPIDSQLFLFDMNGNGIATNDDIVLYTQFNSTLPVGDPLYASLSPGKYLLAISLWDQDPIDSSNQEIFPDQANPFEVLGPVAGRGPLDSWRNDYSNYYSGFGADYQMRLTGAEYCAVPEPASMAALALGGLAVLRRRRK